MLGIPEGTFIGIGVNMMFIMYHAARPKIQMERRYVSDFNSQRSASIHISTIFPIFIFGTDVEEQQIFVHQTGPMLNVPIGGLCSKFN